MKLANFKIPKGALYVSLLLSAYLFYPCLAGEKQDEQNHFLRHLSTIRQPGQRLGFSVNDTATYFGLSDGEKADLLDFLSAVWTNRVMATHGLTAQEYITLKGFLIGAFQDTLRNYGWTENEKTALANFKKLYYDETRVKEDTPAGRELRAAWVQHQQNLKLAEENRKAMEEAASLKDPNAEQRREKQRHADEEMAVRRDPVKYAARVKAVEEEQRRILEAEARASNVKLSYRADGSAYIDLSGGRGDIDLGDPKYYHGLSEKEVADLFAFTRPLYKDTNRNVEAERLRGKVSDFLIWAFIDTTRNYGWTNQEKQRLAEFRSRAEELRRLNLLSPANTFEKK